jgi:teichuronic acid biosynthesis glycosyltransferase TuaG
MPLVSVITPVYNAARWLPETIASVQAQTLTDWEHILVDDGSTDESVALVQEFADKDPRIHLLQMPYNAGPAAARKRALDAAQGRFIAFLDADDLWLPEKLARCIDFMTAQKYEFIYHDCRQFYRIDAPCEHVLAGPNELNFRTLHTRRGVRIFTVMLDRRQIADFQIPQGYFRYLHEDFITWLWLIQNGHVGHRFPVDLGRYRLVERSLGANKLEAAQKVWKLYRDVSRLSYLRAASWWMQYAWNSLWRRRYTIPEIE